MRRSSTIEQNQLEQAISENDSLILEGTRFPILGFSGGSKVRNGEDSRQLVNYYKKKIFVGLSIIFQENKFNYLKILSFLISILVQILYGDTAMP